jgi:CDP-2,3-bis-(O-geranylgeranyl)-sn-glycerol synthase
VFDVLLLVMVANGAPILLARLVRGRRRLQPVDFGYELLDGRPLFGRSKTWAGVLAATVSTSIFAVLLGLDWRLGFGAGMAAMLGDLSSSFLKRRMRIAPSGQAVVLDHVPEALLPALVLGYWLPLTAWEMLASVLLFFLLGQPLSSLLFRLGIRKKPY